MQAGRNGSPLRSLARSSWPPAALKIGHAPALAGAIAGFRLLPPASIPALAVVLPPFEILVGLYLIAGLLTRIAGGVAAGMFVLYAVAIASAVVRGIPANCGCFGPGERGDRGLAARRASTSSSRPSDFSSPGARPARWHSTGNGHRT